MLMQLLDVSEPIDPAVFDLWMNKAQVNFKREFEAVFDKDGLIVEIAENSIQRQAAADYEKAKRNGEVKPPPEFNGPLYSEQFRDYHAKRARR